MAAMLRDGNKRNVERGGAAKCRVLLEFESFQPLPVQTVLKSSAQTVARKVGLGSISMVLAGAPAMVTCEPSDCQFTDL